MTAMYEKVAEVLDLLAEYIDEVEGTKQAAETAAKNQYLDKIAERYEASTGEAMPAGIRSKFANLDQDALDHLIKVAHNNNGTPEALGQPTEIVDNMPPRTVKEAAVRAENDFLTWLIQD